MFGRFVKVGLALTALLLLAALQVVHASDPHKGYRSLETPFSWTSIYLGGAVGFGIGDNAVTFSDGQPVPMVLGVEGLSSRSWQGKARAGADWQIGNTMFVIGVWGEYSKDLGTDDGFNVTITGPGQVLTANIEPQYAAGVRAGVVLTPTTLFYAGYGYGRGNFNLNIAAPGACGAGAFNCDQDVNGRVIKIGIEQAVAKQLTIGIEYGRTDWDKVQLLPAAAAPATLHVEPVGHEIMLHVNWRPQLGLF